MLLQHLLAFPENTVERGHSGRRAHSLLQMLVWGGGHSNGLLLQTPESLTDRPQNHLWSGKKGCAPTRPGGRGGASGLLG